VLYEAHRSYRGEVNGRRFAFAAGDLVRLDLADVGPLSRDAGFDVVDFAHPLTEEQATARRRELEKAAAADAAALEESARARALADHIRRFGPVCPGLPDRPVVPVPLGTSDRLHPSAGLRAARNAAGEWVVACPDHLVKLAASTRIPELPPRPDPTPRRWRVTRRYQANYIDHHPTGPLGAAPAPRRLDLAEGQYVELPIAVATWIDRDSPGALEPAESGLSLPSREPAEES